MKILKVILIVVVALVAIVAVIGLFLPSKVHVERTMLLKSSPDAVYTQISDLKDWNNWMPYNKMDKNIKINYGSKTAGEGATYSWESENSNLGTGSVTESKSVPNQLVETQMDFHKNGNGTSVYTINKTDAGTNVTWAFDCDMGANPFKKVMGAMMDKMMGPVFDQGLRSLDSAAALMPPAMPMTASADTTKKMGDAMGK